MAWVLLRDHMTRALVRKQSSHKVCFWPNFLIFSPLCMSGNVLSLRTGASINWIDVVFSVNCETKEQDRSHSEPDQISGQPKVLHLTLVTRDMG